jgi:isopenicillin-N epimerase
LDVGVVELSNEKFHPATSPDVYLKAFEKAITPRTRLLSFCHINYSDGAVMPVKEICAMARSKGVMTLVDGAQPPGMLELDLHDLGCDMYAAPFHKWMLSSMLTGFFYARADMQERVNPILGTMPPGGIGMYGVPVTHPYWDEYQQGAARYEPRGSHDVPARMAMAAAIDFHRHLTPRAIEARDRYLARRLHDGLQRIKGVKTYASVDPRLNSALVPFTVDRVATGDLNELLWKRHNIYIRKVTHKEVNWDVNRASLHIMVTTRQVDFLLGALEEIARS